jgi:lipoic acid synthetase
MDPLIIEGHLLKTTTNASLKMGKPPWLKRRLPSGPEYERVRRLIRTGALHTVCQEAQCPNQFECFSRQTATFLILGDRCTRNCGFCAVASGLPGAPDRDEPDRVAQAAAQLNLRYVVVTSVTRDDLSDGGAAHFAATIKAIKSKNADALVEVLIPDFKGSFQALKTVLDAKPDVLNHNVETVPRLYAAARPEADFMQSLFLLQSARDSNPSVPTKSGLMLGLGETDSEILHTIQMLHRHGVSILTLGQYLQPTQRHLPVSKYITPEQFAEWRKTALSIGFEEVASGPFVRSSYRAAKLFRSRALSKGS